MGGEENGGGAAGPPGGAAPAKPAGAGLSSARVRELHAEVGFNEGPPPEQSTPVPVSAHQRLPQSPPPFAMGRD